MNDRGRWWSLSVRVRRGRKRDKRWLSVVVKRDERRLCRERKEWGLKSVGQSGCMADRCGFRFGHLGIRDRRIYKSCE